MTLRDELNAQSDVRRLRQLVDRGQVTARELEEAPIVDVVPSCACRAGLEPRQDGELRCPQCGAAGQEVEA